MGQKDVAEKTLEAYNDVFSDIVNVLLFDGEQIVKEEDLENESPLSQYKADDKLHEQERDVAKFWKGSDIRIALLGLENQTAMDIDMPLRVISYDGAAYRAQLLNKEQKKRFPVVTLVLYFGEKRWEKGRTLYECLEIPEIVKPYVSDYKVNIFEICYLAQEQVSKFKSDFRFVADYFVQVHNNKEYIPSKETITHVHEVFQLMSILTQDNRFEEAANENGFKKEAASMCEILDRVENRGMKQGIALGRENEKTELAQKLLAGKICTDEKVAELTGLSMEKIIQIKNKMSNLES